MGCYPGRGQVGTIFKGTGKLLKKQGQDWDLWGWTLSSAEWVNREVLSGDLKKGGRRVRAEDLGSTMWLGDKAGGRAGEKHMVIFGSMGDWKLGKGGNWDVTDPQQGWNEWNREGGWPYGEEKRLSIQMVLGSPTSPGVSQQSDFTDHPHHLVLACLATLLPCSDHGNPSFWLAVLGW